MGGQGSKDFKAECSNVLIRHEDTVTCCAFSPNEKLLATCSTDKQVIVWDFRKNRAIFVLQQHKAPVTCCCFSANSRILISAGMDKMLAVWDVEKGTLKRKYGGHDAGILFCVYAPGSDFLFATAGEVSLQLHVSPPHLQCGTIGGCACVGQMNVMALSSSGVLSTNSQMQKHFVQEVSQLALLGPRMFMLSNKFISTMKFIVSSEVSS